jgi:AraC family transcriptional regulator of adaptative response/methylated-DNA-[protein]-cysteine methyltransferase
MNKPFPLSETLSEAAEPRWAAVSGRDRGADGEFVYSVRSTGVYCRPSCPSRRPRRENVDFHPSPAAAEAAGFRACKRCRPDEADAASVAIAAACRSLDAAEAEPALAELAQAAGLSAPHFQKLFKAALGVSPSAYFKARRAAKARAALEGGASVTEAIYAAGFNSSGRFYEASDGMLGMKPSTYRDGAKGERITFAIGQSTLGAVLAASTERGVCAILLGDDPDALLQDFQRRFPNADLVGGDSGFEALVARVAGLVENPATQFDLPLDVRGTAFQMRVWAALQAIPMGKTADYSEIADRIGAPSAARAVARACAANPVAVAIPCHRVVRRDGDLSGYRWGVDRKRTLLERERKSGA